MTTVVEKIEKPQAAQTAQTQAKKQHRQPLRRFLIITHRWLSLVLGILVLIVTMSGSILLYRAEIHRAFNSDAFHAQPGPTTVSLVEAADAIQQRHREFAAERATTTHGVYYIYNKQQGYTVDPATGREIGKVAPEPAWLSVLVNLHFCLMSCPHYEGYLPILATPIPGTQWLSRATPAKNLSVAQLLLGSLGLILLYLAISGIWLWWPRRGRWAASLKIRFNRGRFARDADLHKVIGIVAIPLLIIWGWTGAGFEFKQVRDLWTTTTFSSYVPQPVVKATGTATVTPVQAVEAVQRSQPNAVVTLIRFPSKTDPTSVYQIYTSHGIDPYRYSNFAGTHRHSVDPATGQVTTLRNAPGTSWGQYVWDSWNFPVHAGTFVCSWLRIVWLLLSLAPLALAVTGLSTWLVRSSSQRRRRHRRQQNSAALSGN